MSEAQESGKELAWDPVDPFDEQDTYFWVKIEHLARYMFAADYLQERQTHIVADIACGMGYGLAELERSAAKVVGVDNSAEVLEIAQKRYQASKVQFVHCDLDASHEDLLDKLGASSIGSIICFETLEHLVDPSHALEQFYQILKPNGDLICSVPNLLYEDLDRAGLPLNKYHKQLFSYTSFSHLLKQAGFTIQYRVGQAWTNALFKREKQLLQDEVIKACIGKYTCINTPDIIRLLARLLAYPTAEEVEGSYSLIVVAQKT